MKEKIDNLIARFNFYFHHFVKRLQNVCLWFALLTVYFFGIGLTKILIFFIGRKLLRPFNVPDKQSSYWVDAQGYHHDELEKYEQQV